jgi:hypothetical protein
VHPVEDQVVGLGSLELGGHVAGSVHSRESEVTIVGFEVATDLGVNEVGSPGFGDVPSEGSDPVLGTNSGHGTISVSGVVEHSVLALESFIDPLGALSASMVLNADFVGAEGPSLNILRNVHGLSNIITTEVVQNGVSESAWGKTIGVVGSEEGSVISSRVSILLGGVSLVHLGVGFGTVANSEYIVHVHLSGKGIELLQKGGALVGDHHRHATEVAIVGDDLIAEILTVKGVPVAHFNVGGRAIIIIVGHTVSNHESLEVGLEDIGLLSMFRVVLVHVVGQVGHVDSGI